MRYGTIITISGLLILAACGDDMTGSSKSPASIVQMGNPSGTPGWLLDEPLAVSVKDGRGLPVADVEVIWSTDEEQASLQQTSSMTDADGIARVDFVPGWRIGSQKVRAVIGAEQIELTVGVATLDLVSIAHGDGFCGLDRNGRLWCWETMPFRSRGTGGSRVTAQSLPTSPAPDARYRDLIDFGTGGFCALTLDDELQCWGSSFASEGADDRTPTTITTPAPFRSLAASSRCCSPALAAMCAIDRDGMAWCRGDNRRGQLGDGTKVSRDGFAPVSGDVRFRSLTGGGQQFCGIDRDHHVWCWGGPASGDDVPVPTRMAGNLAIAQLAFSYHGPCGIEPVARQLHCWWSGFMEGVAAAGTAPVPIPGGEQVVEMAGRGNLGVFRRAGGRLAFAGDLYHSMPDGGFFGRPADLPRAPWPPTPGGFTTLLLKGSEEDVWCASHQDGAALCAHQLGQIIGVPLPR